MSRKVYREVVYPGRWHEVELRGPILHVATRQEDAVEFWHLHDDEQPATLHAFIIQGTGSTLAPALARHVGTAITPSGRFVWHLFEHEPLAVTRG